VLRATALAAGRLQIDGVLGSAVFSTRSRTVANGTGMA
jgi:hypothetical protein